MWWTTPANSSAVSCHCTNVNSGSTIANVSSSATSATPVTIASSGAMRSTAAPTGNDMASIAAGVATTLSPGSCSGSRTRALRIVERGVADLCLAAVDRHEIGDGRALLPTQHHAVTEARRVEARCDVADDVVTDED